MQQCDGERRDIWIRDDRICEAPNLAAQKTATMINLNNAVVMAGAIDIHSHIAGGNVNTAR